jgi:DNA replication protein DnaC
MSPADFEAATRRVSLEAQASLEAERQANRQAAMQRVLSGAGIPKRYQGAKFDNSDTSVNPFAWESAERYALDFGSALDDGRGLLLWGDVGTGKTHLACAVGNALLAQHYSVIYTNTFELIAGVKAAWRSGGGDREESELAFYRRMQKPDLMILDEIGVQNNTEFERVVLSTIIEGRSRECRPIIAISNLKPSQISGVIGQRAFDRLIGFGGEILKFSGASLRVRSA